MNCPRCDAPSTTEKLRQFGGVCERCLLDFAAERDAPAFPNLEIVETLGEGGMGVVYKAVQKPLGRTVALKVLSPALSSDPAFVERFTREARALAQLSHPNIVGIHDFGVHDGVPFLVMDYVDGPSLRKLLGSRKLAPARALEVVPQICDALAYAHSRGVVHRDIKPENILVDREGRVKIADFGLAKLADPDQTRLTRTDALMGTPQYMAPEQVENPNRVDHRADIYSLGVIFYEMLTGELPIGRFKAPSERADVDHRLDPVVLKSLEKAPEDRWQSADAMRDRVTRLEETPPATTVVPAKRSIVPWIAVSAGAAVLTLGLAVVLARKAPDEPGGAVSLPWIVFAPLAAAGGLMGLIKFARLRRPLAAKAWLVFAVGVALALFAMSVRGEALEVGGIASMVCIGVANIMALVALFMDRGAPAKLAAAAIPLVSLTLAAVSFVGFSAARPAAPSPRSTWISRVGEVRLNDVFPAPPPAGLAFVDGAQLAQLQAEAKWPFRDSGALRTRVEGVSPGTILVVGQEFADEAAVQAWERRAARPDYPLSERRLVGGRTVVSIFHGPGASTREGVEALWGLMQRRAASARAR